MNVAVVGGGPKALGLLCELEKLAIESGTFALNVTVFDPFPPGAGEVWDARTPEHLIMNVRPEVADFRCPAWSWSFGDWVSRVKGVESPEYPPRRWMGEYLTEVFRAVAKSPHFDVEWMPERVTGLEQSDAALETQWLVRSVPMSGSTPDIGSMERAFDAVVLATGHHNPQSATWHQRIMNDPALGPGTNVRVRGAALTAIDAVLDLTEGRGGVWLEEGKTLRYVPSGHEPRSVTLVSRTGVPLSPKPPRIAEHRRDIIRASCEPLRELSDTSEVQPSSMWWDTLIAAAVSVARTWGLETPPQAFRQVLFADELGDAASPTALQRMEASLAMNRGDVSPDERWVLGRVWQGGYATIISSLDRKERDPEQWARFRDAAARLERWAYGPPERTVRRLVSLTRSGWLRWEMGSGERHDIDAVTSAPGVAVNEHRDTLWAGLRAAGHVYVREGERGVLTTSRCQCVGGSGAETPGLFALGRPTEDPIIGHDTLNHHLHGEAARLAHTLVLAAKGALV